MINHLPRFIVLGFLFSFVCTAAAQANQDTAGVFEKAGFTLHGEMPGFYTTSRPAKTPKGIILPGRVPQIGQAPWEGPAAIFHVATGETTIIAPPDIGPGAGKPWAMFDDVNRKGWVVGTTASHLDGKGDHLENAYIRKPDDTLIHIPAPPSDQIAPCDINDAGQVVGWYSPTRNWRGFLWSQQEGFVDLGEGGVDTVQATNINKHGMIVGKVQKNGVRHPRVWLPPKQPGAEREVKTLDIPEGQAFAIGGDVNDDGVVVVIGMRWRDDPTGTGRRYGIPMPYTWTVKDGYQKIHHPEVEYANPRAICKDEFVLLICLKKFEFPNPLRFRTAEYYLSNNAKSIELPDYPGADYTKYENMSDDGLITGMAYFNTEDSKENIEVITFVISMKQDQPNQNE